MTHQALSHLENKDSYVRLLFLDLSSASNSIILQKLVSKLAALGASPPLCNWVLGPFLTCRQQSVGININTSSTVILSTGSPQGCVLSPLLYTLIT